MSQNEPTPKQFLKSPLRRIVIFGAAARGGGSVAAYLRYAAPHIPLRLVTSSAERLAALGTRFPGVEAVTANYYDPASLLKAFDNADGVFIITPTGLDEKMAMKNIIDAGKSTASLRHVIRIVGYEPEATIARIPEHLAGRTGDATQHFIAKSMLDESGLPVTFLNCGATLMDNFIWFRLPICRSDTLIYPPRYIPFLDVRDLGEVAARVFLSDDSRHIGQFHTVNNGYDQLTTPEIAHILSDVLHRNITYDTTREAFLREYGPFINAHGKRAGEAEYRWDFLAFEYQNAVVWALNNFAERMLGRRPTTLRSWFMEHRHHFAPSVD